MQGEAGRMPMMKGYPVSHPIYYMWWLMGILCGWCRGQITLWAVGIYILVQDRVSKCMLNIYGHSFKIIEQNYGSKLCTVENKRNRKYNFCFQDTYNLMQGFSILTALTSCAGWFFAAAGVWGGPMHCGMSMAASLASPHHARGTPTGWQPSMFPDIAKCVPELRWGVTSWLRTTDLLCKRRGENHTQNRKFYWF